MLFFPRANEILRCKVSIQWILLSLLFIIIIIINLSKIWVIINKFGIEDTIMTVIQCFEWIMRNHCDSAVIPHKKEQTMYNYNFLFIIIICIFYIRNIWNQESRKQNHCVIKNISFCIVCLYIYKYKSLLISYNLYLN